MYHLWNETDQVYAAPQTFKTEDAALEYAKRFRERFAEQGYYRTAGGLRIKPEDVELVVVDAEE